MNRTYLFLPIGYRSNDYKDYGLHDYASNQTGPNTLKNDHGHETTKNKE